MEGTLFFPRSLGERGAHLPLSMPPHLLPGLTWGVLPSFQTQSFLGESLLAIWWRGQGVHSQILQALHCGIWRSRPPFPGHLFSKGGCNSSKTKTWGGDYPSLQYFRHTFLQTSFTRTPSLSDHLFSKVGVEWKNLLVWSWESKIFSFLQPFPILLPRPPTPSLNFYTYTKLPSFTGDSLWKGRQFPEWNSGREGRTHTCLFHRN